MGVRFGTETCVPCNSLGGENGMQTLLFINLVGVLIIVLPNLTMAQSDSAHALCSQTFKDALAAVDLNTTEFTNISKTVRNTCSANSSKSENSLTGSLKTIVGKVPTLGKLSANFGMSSDKKMCSFFDEFAVADLDTLSLHVSPSTEMAIQYKECMAAADHGIAITTSEVKPDKVGFKIWFDHGVVFDLSSVMADDFDCFATSPGFLKKTIELGPTTPLSTKQPLAISCSREGKGVGDSRAFSDASILINSPNLPKPYIQTVLGDTLLGPNSNRQKQAQIDALRQEVSIHEKRISGVTAKSVGIYFSAAGDRYYDLKGHKRRGCDSLQRYQSSKDRRQEEAAMSSQYCEGANNASFILVRDFKYSKLGKHGTCAGLIALSCAFVPEG
jgi:hypothetical protein